MNLFPPNVNANELSVQIGDSVRFSTLFAASDLDGNELTAFRFRDNNASTTSGFFTVRGTIQPANVLIEVPASDLSFVRYHAGLIVGSETFSVQVSDGQRLSNVDAATVFTVVGNFFPPVITPIATEVLESERIDASSLFTVSDPENNEIVSYFFNDRSPNANGGHFRLNGVRQPSAAFFRISADQLEDLQYVGGQFSQTERVAIQAFDGEFSSVITDVEVTTAANDSRPVTTAFNLNTPLSRVVAAESLFSYFDADGNTLKSVGFLDTGSNPDSGFFTISGVRQDAGSFFFVPVSQLPDVKYNVSDSSDSEIYRVITNDGRFDSAAASGTVTAVPRPQLGVEDTDLILNGLETIDFVDVVSQVDAGPDLTQYQVIDQNLTGQARAARLVLNGEELERGVIHTLTPVQFASLQIRGGFADFRSQSDFLVRGRNQLFFTDWEEFRVNTEINLDDALESGAQFGEEADNGEKFVITYTFIEGGDPTDDDVTTPPVPSYYADDSDFRDGPAPLDANMRLAVREGLDLIETYADLEFVEVPFTPDAADASITFGLSNGVADGALGVTLVGGEGPPGLGALYGDIWFNRNFYPEFQTPTQVGSDFFQTAIHEIGHAIGFEHPFSPPVTVPTTLDFTVFSLLAAQDAPFIDNNGFLQTATPESFSYYDIAQVQDLYRPNEEFNLGNDHYFFTNQNTTRTIYDAGGRDTINLTNTVIGQTIDLHQGAFSSVNGNPFAAAISYGTVIENARGGGNGDTLIGNSSRNLLFGNGGNDTLEGNGGNDVLRGGAGRDTYVWRTGDGRDRIDEQRSAGVDAIHIIDDTALSSLSDDIVFRRFGRDLRIDLRFNRGQAQGSLVVTDQQFGRSRVETLRFFNTEGDQIGEDIDLDSIFQQADSTAQFFELTSQQTNRGFIAIPT